VLPRRPPAEFTEAVRRPAYEQVAAQPREAILSGALEPGSELPSEQAYRPLRLNLWVSLIAGRA